MSVTFEFDTSVNGEAVTVVDVVDAEAGAEMLKRRVPFADAEAVDQFLSDAEAMFGPDTAGRLRSELKVEEERSKATKANAWGRIIPLTPPAPPSLPDGVVTGPFGDYTHAVARFTETPPEMAMMLGLVCAATVVQNRLTVRVEPHYFEPLSFWAAAAMESGSRKSAVVKAMVRPLLEWERLNRVELDPIIKKAQSRLISAMERIKVLRAEAVKKKMDGQYDVLVEQIAELEANLPIVPTVPRLLSEDITPEHLATLMSQNDERIGNVSDEAGVFGMMGGRYSEGRRNIDVYLKGHSGSFIRNDRGSRPSVMLNHPALSIGVSPQPGALAGLAKDREFRDRGLLARWAYVQADAKIGRRALVSTPIPADVEEGYARVIAQLAEIVPNEDEDGKRIPYTLTLDGAAWHQWKQFQREVEDQMGRDGPLEHLRDWGSKLPGMVARLAALLHCLDLGGECVRQTVIAAATMARAVTLGRFLIPHAQATFALMGADPAYEAATAVSRWIETAQPERFTVRDVWHHHRSRFPRVKDIEPAFELLITHNHIAEPPQVDQGRLGRPSRYFIVNPAVRGVRQ